MRVPIDYRMDPNYSLLASEYGEKQAIKILQSGIPINRPGIVPSLQVPSQSGSGCDPLSLGRIRVLGGLGIRTDPCEPSPSWCDYIPFDGLFQDCKPIDPVACQKSQFGPGMTRASKAAALAAGDESVAAYCRAYPEMCKAYEDAKATEYLQKALLVGGAALAVLLVVR